jgi:hypothetical protein
MPSRGEWMAGLMTEKTWERFSLFVNFVKYINKVTIFVS